MQLDWTTFALEILNFLVLLWLLQRFLYRPVLGVLEARQGRVRDETARAERLQAEAAALKTRYETRLADWERSQEQARQKLEQELTQARAARLEGLKQSLADEEAKARARADAVSASREAVLKRAAREEAYAAAAAMLQRLASPELSARIGAAFREDLAALSETDLTTLRNAAAGLEPGKSVDIATAHPLDEQTRAQLRDALGKAAGQPLPVVFHESPELIAGLRAAVGECVLHANLADELAFFRQPVPHG